MISKNSRPPSAWNFKSLSHSLEQFFLTVGQNNFGYKIPFLLRLWFDSQQLQSQTWREIRVIFQCNEHIPHSTITHLARSSYTNSTVSFEVFRSLSVILCNVYLLVNLSVKSQRSILNFHHLKIYFQTSWIYWQLSWRPLDGFKFSKDEH